MTATLRVGELQPAHRPRLAQILRATRVFNDAEVAVALELFDEVYGAEGGEHAGGASADGASGRVPGGAADAPPVEEADYCFIGAFGAGDELVGYACYGPTPSTDRTYDLYWIAVDPAAQGTGTGTLLIGEVERRAAARQARLLIIETSSRPEYAATRAFYQARAYDEAARVGSFYAPGDDRVIYTKRVQAAPEGRGVAAP
jgi:GNAT superfamily N-acetyltransferase